MSSLVDQSRVLTRRQLIPDTSVPLNMRSQRTPRNRTSLRTTLLGRYCPSRSSGRMSGP